MAGGAGLWAAAWEEVRAGRPGEAEQMCRAALTTEPGSAEGWFLLGVACHCQNRTAEAADGYARALHLRPDYVEAQTNLGSALRNLGRPIEAEACFRQILKLRPDSPDAHYNLGNALRDQGRSGEAVACFERALEMRPEFPEAWNNLGNALQDQGRPREAVECFRQALRLRPDLPGALINLGSALQEQGRLDEAVDCLQQARRQLPDAPESHYNLGNALQEQGRLDEAKECFQQALRLRPDYAEALNNLGNVLLGLGRLGYAEECLRQALRLRPRLPGGWINLGNALQDQGRLGEAEECFRQALEQRSDSPEVYNNLGVVLRDLGRPSEAERSLAQALTLQPEYTAAHYNLGVVLRGLGRMVEAEACFRRAMDLAPGHAAAQSGLLQTLHYKASVTPEELSAAHADYQRRHAAPLRAAWRPFTNDRNPERPLRLGLVSPDLGHHPVGFLLVRAAEALARRPGTVTCYSDRRVPPDDLTARFKAAAQWRDVAGLTDERLAETIRADGVDVLIDLTGHTAGNRLLTFARRPAPVQCTWLGYEGTTGLEAIGYLIADERLVPPGAEAHCRERVLRLPGGYACYDPLAQAPQPGPPPALAAGRVTFGCFNNPAKLSAPVVALWAGILQRVPGARLLLKYRGLDNEAAAGWLVGLFTSHGVGPERVEMRGVSRHADYLAAYRDLDIALDTFPFGGGVTTCDALWMGVPVITLPGETFASRHGLSHLTSVGLADELAARNADDYAVRATELAQDLSRLTRLRAELRERVARSPLCDGDRLADELLVALRSAWRDWATGPVER